VFRFVHLSLFGNLFAMVHNLMIGPWIAFSIQCL
jgi:hypothetical protein